MRVVRTKTPHPCAGMTPAQRRDFELIAVNERPLGGYRTLNKLLARGVICKGEPQVLGRDALGLITVPSWFVPPDVHYQWCKWCSEQPEQANAGSVR
jgi:hypothetical protein